MRNRDYKQFGAGQYYHIYNRGNEKRDIFLDNEDFKFFLRKLRQDLFPDDPVNRKPTWALSLPPESFSLISYCLMPNHFHFLLRQNTDLPNSKLMSKLCTSYAIYFNKKNKRIGHLFQDQFKQILIDDNSYLVWLSAYIHQNPKVAGLVNKTEDYMWSSYREFLGLRTDKLCETNIILGQFDSQEEYRKFTDESIAIIKARKDINNFLLEEEKK